MQHYTKYCQRLSLLSLLIMLMMIGIWSAQAQDADLLPLPENASPPDRIFSPVQELKPSDPADYDYFGRRIALEENTLLEGSYFPDMYTGSAYIFERQMSGEWQETASLRANDTKRGDYFGYAIALEEKTAVIGAIGHDTHVDDEGAVYIFHQEPNGQWKQWQKLSPPGLAPNSYFGSSVAIDGDRMVISAQCVGDVYLYHRNADQLWQLEAKLHIGQEVFAVAINGSTVVIGTPNESHYTGAAYLYRYQQGTWKFLAKLTAVDGQQGDEFGNQVALLDDQAFVSASLDNEKDKLQGAVYVFTSYGNTWMQTQKLIAEDANIRDQFGAALALNDKRLAIGAPGDCSDAGSVYTFVRTGLDWQPSGKIFAVGHQFGSSVALQEGMLVSGAPYAHNFQGRVYIYSDSGLIPTPTATGEVTPEITDTLLAPVELLVDGGFEAAASNWTVRNTTSDKVKCNKPNKVIAHTGNCAWRFKGGAGENAKIRQVMTTGANIGDRLTLSGVVNASGDVNSKVKIVITYQDQNIPKSKLTVNVNTVTNGYVPLANFQPVLTTYIDAPPEKLKFQVKNSSTSGKIYYDALSLTAQ
jgi:hypothetical protein